MKRFEIYPGTMFQVFKDIKSSCINISEMKVFFILVITVYPFNKISSQGVVVSAKVYYKIIIFGVGMETRKVFNSNDVFASCFDRINISKHLR